MRRYIFLILTSTLFFACKTKDNNYEFELGQYVQKQILTSGKITDTLFSSSVIIYLPAGYNENDESVKYPIIYFLHPFGANYIYYKSVYDLGTLMSYLVSKGEIEPAILVFVNGRNIFGGSFYVNSQDPANKLNVYGKYEDYIIEEVIPQVENVHLNKNKLNGKRYIAGYSMGGYGSVWLGLNYSKLFNKVASISGPLGFSIFTQPEAQNLILQILKAENAGFGNRLPLGFDTLAQTLGSKKLFTTFIVALSAAFSPKYGSCADFINPDSIKYIYITHNIGSNCIGFRLPLYKDLSSTNNSVLSLWLSKDPLSVFVFNAPIIDTVIKNDVKFYISVGRGGDTLEAVIYRMDSVFVSFMKQRYSQRNKDPNEYIYYNVISGSTDPFGFPATHNQYVYTELSEVLKFFLKK
ncbi:MAG: alpha/beta hydrolase-fold protein [candidate division WOR-3 bacterium]|nr:alpha/beta hydrolase-fold protein [candidate division WOR-3 bacterium]MDW8150521.1 alpha/beta hydrolase-fold protein [candidate division WOR-3 bacterium]